MPQYSLFNALKHNPMFANLDEYSFHIIENYLSFKALAAGEVLFEEGDRGNFMAIVVAGKLDILKKTQTLNNATNSVNGTKVSPSQKKHYNLTNDDEAEESNIGSNINATLFDDSYMTRLGIINEGDSIGEMAMIDELPRSATIRALERSGLILLPNKDFERILQEHPRIGIEMLKGIARKLSINLRRTSDVVSKKSK